MHRRAHRRHRWLLVVIAAALLLGFACQDAGAAADAASVWTKKCQGCHGADGKAKTKMGEKHKIPDITTAEFQGKHSDDQILEIISNGVPNTKMPAWKEKLEAEEIKALVTFVRGLGKK